MVFELFVGDDLIIVIRISAGSSRPSVSVEAPECLMVHVESGFSHVPRDPVTHSARCRRPSPPLSSGFRIEILPYPLGPVMPYLASTTVGRWIRTRPGIFSLGGMSSLGTVQRCQNSVVLPSLHGGLPPAQTLDRYVHGEYN